MYSDCEVDSMRNKYATKSLIGLLVGVLATAVAATPPRAMAFHWNWRDAGELSALQDLTNVRLTQHERFQLASLIKSDIGTDLADEDEVGSKSILPAVFVETRVALVKLHPGSTPDVVAQWMGNGLCSPTGNCPFWIFERRTGSYKLILKGFGQTFTVQSTRTNGYKDIVLAAHGSATSSGLTLYKYNANKYREAGCFDAEWTVLEGDTIRELKEPRVTPYPCSD